MIGDYKRLQIPMNLKVDSYGISVLAKCIQTRRSTMCNRYLHKDKGIICQQTSVVVRDFAGMTRPIITDHCTCISVLILMTISVLMLWS